MYNSFMMTYDDSYKLKQGTHFAVAQMQLGEFSPRLHTHLHCHRDMELLLIDEGETVMQIAGREIRAGEGDLVLINPYEVHSGEALEGNYAHRCICFDLGQLGLPNTGELLSGQMGYASVVSQRDIANHFSACFEAVQNRTEGWELRAKGHLLVLFASLTGQMHTTTPTKAQNFSKGVLDYVDAHFAEEITSKAVAAQFSYDHSYFCRKFKALFSQNFSDFLTGYRIRKAEELLRTHSVSQTATLCGFQSISYFSKVFKAVTGLPPSAHKR